MIWTLILRFTIADIRCVVHTMSILHSSKTSPTVKRVCPQKRVFFFGVSERLSRMKKLMFRTSRIVGLTVSPVRPKFSMITPVSDAYKRCALIHCHRPDLLDYDSLDKAWHRLSFFSSDLLMLSSLCRMTDTQTHALHFASLKSTSVYL